MAVHIVFSFVYNRDRGSNASSSSILLPAWPFYVIMLSGIRRNTRASRVGAFLQTLLFASAFWLVARAGGWSRDLLSPIFIGAGFLAGHLVFGISVLLTHKSARQALSHMATLGPLWDFMADNPRVLMQYASVSIAEETIYRAGLQPLAMEWFGAFGIAVVAVVFACVHEHFFRNSILQSGEFLAFSFLLGLLYFWTGSLILVMVVHAVRNIEIAFMERLAMVEESGEPDAGERESLFEEGRLIQALVLAPACGMAAERIDLLIAPAREPGADPVQAQSSRPPARGQLENV
jgi:membrane protease YdiL (CAAX protease family)